MKEPSYQSTSSIVRNLFFGVTTWLLPIGLGFIATPIIVRSLGVANYGIYALVLGFVGYSFSFNIGRALTKFVAEYRLTEDSERIDKLISATLILSFATGVAGVLALCLAANWYVFDISLMTGEAAGTAVQALYVASAIIFALIIGQVFDAVLQGLHRYDVYSKLFNLNSIVLVGGNVILAITGFGLISLLIWTAIVTALTSVAYFFGVKKLMPEFRFRFDIDRTHLKQIAFFSWGLIAYQILSNFLLLFERAWVTRKFGIESVTFYVVPMTLAIYLQGFIASLLLALFPLASELHNNKPRLQKLYEKSNKIACAIIVLAALTLILQSRTLLTLWIGSDFAEKSSDLLILHTITFSSLAILTVSWRMMEGLGRTGYNFFLFAVTFLVTISLFFFLTPRYGLAGVAAARLIGFSLVLISIWNVERIVFGKILWKFWINIGAKLSAAAVIAGLVQIFILRVLALNWISLLLAIGVSVLAYSAMLLLLRFADADDRVLIKGLLSKYVS